MFSKLEIAHKADMQEIKAGLQSLTNRLDEVETIVPPIKTAITELQTAVAAQKTTIQALNTHLEDLEDRGRRNNIRILGLPEATADCDLRATIVGVFNKILGKPVTDHIEVDRVHRTSEFKCSNNTQPQKVLCRVHYFVLKEEILCKAASIGTIDFNSAQLSLFPDFSRRTLLKCRSLWPLTTAL